MIQDFEMTCTVPCSKCGSEIIFTTKNASIYLTTVEEDLRNLKWSVGKAVVCPNCQGITKKTTYSYTVKENTPEDVETEEIPEEGHVETKTVDDYSGVLE